MLFMSISCACCLCLRTKMFLLLTFLCLMNNVVRSYRVSRDVLYCRVDFLPDSADFVDEYHLSALGPEYRFVELSAIVGPSANRIHDLKVESMNCPRSLVFQETITFCQTIQQMYQL